MTGDNYRQRAAILSNACSSFYSCGVFVQRCSSARGSTEETILTMTACQIGQNVRSRGGCTEVLLIVSSRSPSVRTHMFLWVFAGSLCCSRWSHHLHIAERVQGIDTGGLPPSRINVPIDCYYISFLQAFSTQSSFCAVPNLPIKKKE